jgi:MSHA biogenesis protein MshG
MRMQKCPQCGADNSIKRTTCYQCQHGFTSHVVARSKGIEPPRKPEANSRWEAIEPVKRPAARPIQESVPVRVERPPAEAMARPPAQAAPKPRPRGIVAPRSSIKHVREIAQFYRELHSLIKAGITFSTACRELEHRLPHRFRPLVREMGVAADAGKPVSSVLENYRHLIYPWHLGVVRAAESAGALPEALDQIASAYELEWQTRAEVALRVFFYCGLGIPVLMLVLPVILMMNQPMPAHGDWTIEMTITYLRRFFLTASLPLGASVIVLMMTWRMLSATAWFQAVQHRVVLLIPVIGHVSKTGAVARYLSTLAMLLKAGVPVSDSADEAAMAAGNAALTPRLLAVSSKVQAGAPLAQALQETRVFDGDTLRLAGTGEMTGALPEMLGRAAQYLRDKHESQRRMLMRAAGVAFTLAAGIVVGYIVLWGFRSYFDFVFRWGEAIQE